MGIEFFYPMLDIAMVRTLVAVVRMVTTGLHRYISLAATLLIRFEINGMAVVLALQFVLLRNRNKLHSIYLIYSECEQSVRVEINQ